MIVIFGFNILLLSKCLYCEDSLLCVASALYYIHQIKSVLFNYVTDCLIKNYVKKNIYIYILLGIVVFLVIVNYIIDYRSYPYRVLLYDETYFHLENRNSEYSVSPHSTGSKKISIILKYIWKFQESDFE